MNKKIIEKNLKKMTNNSEGSMLKLMGKESWGGNAGRWKGLPCVGANFIYDPETGEILYFENPQTIPKELKGFAEGTLRIVRDIYFEKDSTLKKIIQNGTEKCRIIDSYLPKPISEEAKENLEISIEEYNKRYGFSDIVQTQKNFSNARIFKKEEIEEAIKEADFLKKIEKALNELQTLIVTYTELSFVKDMKELTAYYKVNFNAQVTYLKEILEHIKHSQNPLIEYERNEKNITKSIRYLLNIDHNLKNKLNANNFFKALSDASTIAFKNSKAEVL
ncbi:hypothetical protein HYX16_05115 [Candidatus Woesearchaeota archaeon]|nr:hypothetical protein [Candidatus Woesearchaeota archaeon]